MRDDAVRRVVTTALREVHPTAELVACAPEPVPPGYQLQVEVSGELSKVRHLPGLLLKRAETGDPLAVYTLRTVLRTLIQGLHGRAAAERLREARHRWQTRDVPPAGRSASPPPA